ncbi:MAG: flagellar filament capping protein FliD [Fibrobacterales bacterium]
MAGLSAGGMVSGIDTNAIIDGLSEIEMTRVARVENKKKVVEARQESFNDLTGRIGTLAGLAKNMADKDSFNLFTSKSDDDDVVTLEGDEGASAGSFEIEVQQLASKQKAGSQSFSSFTSTAGLTGTFEVSKTKSAIENDPTETTIEIEIAATDTLKDIATKINSTDGAGISASILSLSDNDHRLIITSIDEGTDGFFMKDTIGSVLGAAGLGFLSENGGAVTQAVRSEFNLVNQAGMAISETDELDKLSTGLGLNNLSLNDSITINGTMADGSAIAATDFVFNPAVDTVGNLLTAIEGAYGGTVNASLNQSGEIVLQDITGGLNEMTLDLTFNDVDADGSSLNMGGSKVVNLFNNVLAEGKKSFYKIDGLAMSAQSNSDENTVRGTKINFHGLPEVPGEAVKVSLTRDYKGIEERIKGFIEQFNSVMDFIDEKSKVNVKEKEAGDSSSQSEVEDKGVFSGDSTVRRLKQELRNMMTGAIEELSTQTQYTSLSRIGITTNSTSGHLEIDSEDLEKALSMDFEGVRALFVAQGNSDNNLHEMGKYTDETQTGSFVIDADNDTINGVAAKRIGQILIAKSGEANGLSVKAPSGTGTGTMEFTHGLASKLHNLYEAHNDYVDGLFKQTKESNEKRVRDYEDKIENLWDKVEAFKSRLVKQFSDMEQSMSRLQSQSSSFMSAMSGM